MGLLKIIENWALETDNYKLFNAVRSIIAKLHCESEDNQ